jgi:hypothetical protein
VERRVGWLCIGELKGSNTCRYCKSVRIQGVSSAWGRCPIDTFTRIGNYYPIEDLDFISKTQKRELRIAAPSLLQPSHINMVLRSVILLILPVPEQLYVLIIRTIKTSTMAYL